MAQARIQLIGRAQMKRAAVQMARLKGEGARDLTKFMREGGEIARNAFALQFRTSGRAFGSPWQPLKPATVNFFKRGSATPTLINVRTSNLRDSLTQRSAERLRGRGFNRSLVLESDAQAADGGGATITVIEADSRRKDKIRHPRTGIGGRDLLKLNAAFDRFVTRLTKRV